MHGPSGQLELDPSKMMGDPATGELGVTVKLALGGSAVTGPTLVLVADALPAALVAVTVTRIVWPTSLNPSVYAEPVAPSLFEQFVPELSQSCHW
ncbi:MAG TPA: hypothetical protein VGY30_12715 [Solirubrobacteraceae bacterium]|nr:hypothetical protein [Solirubrobacteraceae bacterium]